MQVKTDTKERFHAITLPGPVLSATMTDDLAACLVPYLQNDVKNVVINLSEVKEMEPGLAARLVEIQQQFYENQASFVLCCVDKQLEDQLDKWELLELLNITPTESEAWDIVQMEEIERELLGGEEEEAG
jgi:anti-anti-sigma factor